LQKNADLFWFGFDSGADRDDGQVMTFSMLCEICGILPPDMVNRATPIFFGFNRAACMHALPHPRQIGKKKMAISTGGRSFSKWRHPPKQAAT
jgi:hypothetical protein